MEPFDLFVNVPFVTAAATGIDNNAYVGAPSAVKRAYVEAVLHEAEMFARELNADEGGEGTEGEGEGERAETGTEAETRVETAADPAANGMPLVRSVTLGGGSVSSLSTEDLAFLLHGLRRLLPIAPGVPLFVTIDPGRLPIAHANELRAFGTVHPTFRYFTADLREGDRLGCPSSEAEMGKSDILLEHAGIGGVGMRIAVGIPGQTEETLVRTLRLANRGSVERMELAIVQPAAQGQAADPQLAAQTERLFATACQWLAEHGYHRDTVRAFSRNAAASAEIGASTANPLVANWYGAAACAPSHTGACGRVALGSGTLSAWDGLMWSNVGDVNRYIQGQGNPEAVTERVANLDDRAREVQAALDSAYRCENADGSPCDLGPSYGLHFEREAETIVNRYLRESL